MADSAAHGISLMEQKLPGRDSNPTICNYPLGLILAAYEPCECYQAGTAPGMHSE